MEFIDIFLKIMDDLQKLSIIPWHMARAYVHILFLKIIIKLFFWKSHDYSFEKFVAICFVKTMNNYISEKFVIISRCLYNFLLYLLIYYSNYCWAEKAKSKSWDWLIFNPSKNQPDPGFWIPKRVNEMLFCHHFL